MRTIRTLIWMTLLLLAVSPAERATAQPAFLSDGLVAYFPFNGNAKDASGNKHDGITYGVQLIPDRFGFADSAYSFSGTSNWIETGTPVVTRDTQLTFSFWANTSSFSGMDVLGIATQSDSDQDIRIMFNTPQLFQKGLSFKNGSHLATFPFNTYDSVWHHYAMAMGAGDDFTYANFKAYVDGNQIQLGSPSLNWGAWEYKVLNLPLTIGKSYGGGNGGYFNGQLDDIRVYTRALSDAEIKALFDFESSPLVQSPRRAKATAQVVNGFVLGVTVIDGGYGYTKDYPVEKYMRDAKIIGCTPAR